MHSNIAISPETLAHRPNCAPTLRGIPMVVQSPRLFQGHCPNLLPYIRRLVQFFGSYSDAEVHHAGELH
jgi:hypothetical protein